MFIPDPDPDISFFKKPNTDSIKIPGFATLRPTTAIIYLNTKYLKQEVYCMVLIKEPVSIGSNLV